jgi:protease I
MENILSGKRICILAASGFAEEQFSAIHKHLNKSGAILKTVAPENGLVHGWLHKEWGHYFPIDIALHEALGSDFDRIILLGGERGVEKLKGNLHTRRILRHFFAAGKPVAVIAEATELLVAAECAKSLELSVPPSLTAAVEAAGATVGTENATIDGAVLSFAQAEGGWLDILTQHFGDALPEREAA